MSEHDAGDEHRDVPVRLQPAWMDGLEPCNRLDTVSSYFSMLMRVWGAEGGNDGCRCDECNALFGVEDGS